MSVLINLNGDTSFDTEPTAKSLLHGAVQFKPSTGEGRIVKSDGTTQALQNPPTRPKNSQLSGLTLDGEQTLWQNAAFEPNVTRTAPDSFTGNAVASHRLFDDSDRGWWIVVERSGLELIIWLHRPITIFLYRVQPFTPDIELARISLPAGLSDEPLHFHANPRGNQMVVQIISDRSGLPAGQYEGAAAERYSIRWAQFVKVITFTGTGSWPETAAEPDWGVGISAQVGDYASPYSAGTSSLVAERIGKNLSGTNSYTGGSSDGDLYGDPDNQYYYYGGIVETFTPTFISTTDYGFVRCIDYQRQEQLSVPILLFFDVDAQLCELSAHVEITDSIAHSTFGDHQFNAARSVYLSGGDVYDRFDAISTSQVRHVVRAANYSCVIKMNGAACHDYLYQTSFDATATAVIVNGTIQYQLSEVPAYTHIVNGKNRTVDHFRFHPLGDRWRSNLYFPFFDIRPDKHTLVMLQGFRPDLPTFPYVGWAPEYYKQPYFQLDTIDLVGLNRTPAFNELETLWYGVKLHYSADNLGIVTGLPLIDKTPLSEGIYAYDASQFVVSYIVHPKGDKAISYWGGQTYIAYSFVYDYSNSQAWMGVGWV